MRRILHDSSLGLLDKYGAQELRVQSGGMHAEPVRILALKAIRTAHFSCGFLIIARETPATGDDEERRPGADLLEEELTEALQERNVYLPRNDK